MSTIFHFDDDKSVVNRSSTTAVNNGCQQQQEWRMRKERKEPTDERQQPVSRKGIDTHAAKPPRALPHAHGMSYRKPMMRHVVCGRYFASSDSSSVSAKQAHTFLHA